MTVECFQAELGVPTSSSSPVKLNHDQPSCICGETKCSNILARWARINDNTRRGFFLLPKAEVDDKNFEGKMLPLVSKYLSSLNQNGFNQASHGLNISWMREGQENLIAYHHFHPLVLKEGNRGPKLFIRKDKAEKVGLDLKFNLIRSGSKKGRCVVTPNYPWAKILMDLETKEHQSAASSSVPVYVGRCGEMNESQNTTNLCSLLMNKKFIDAHSRLKTHPEELSQWIERKSSRTGDTFYRKLPLHVACNFGAPKTLTLTMINLYPSALQETDEKGRLPIHIILSAHVSLDVIQEMLKLYPESATVSDNNGMLPIHHASSSGASDVVINALFLAHPGSVLKKDIRGRRSNQFMNRSTMKTELLLLTKNIVDDEITITTNDSVVNASSIESVKEDITKSSSESEGERYNIRTKSGVSHICKKEKVEECTADSSSRDQVENDSKLVSSSSNRYMISLKEILAFDLFRKGQYSAALKYFESELLENSLSLAKEVRLRNNIATCYSKQQDYIKAEKEFEKAITLSVEDEKLRSAESSQIFFNKGCMHLHQKDYEEALTSFLRAKEIRLNGESISDCTLIGTELNEIVAILHYIAKIYNLTKKFENVLDIYEELVMLKENMPTISLKEGLGTIFANMANINLRLGKQDKALSFYRLSLRKCSPNDKHVRLKSLHGLAKMYAEEGDLESAAEAYEASLPLVKEGHGSESMEIARAYHNLAIIYRKSGNHIRAEDFFEEALLLTVKNSGDSSIECTQILLDCAKNYYDMELFDEASMFIMDAGRLAIALDCVALSTIHLKKDIQKWLKKVVKGKMNNAKSLR